MSIGKALKERKKISVAFGRRSERLAFSSPSSRRRSCDWHSSDDTGSLSFDKYSPPPPSRYRNCEIALRSARIRVLCAREWMDERDRLFSRFSLINGSRIPRSFAPTFKLFVTAGYTHILSARNRRSCHPCAVFSL